MQKAIKPKAGNYNIRIVVNEAGEASMSFCTKLYKTSDSMGEWKGVPESVRQGMLAMLGVKDVQ